VNNPARVSRAAPEIELAAWCFELVRLGHEFIGKPSIDGLLVLCGIEENAAVRDAILAERNCIGNTESGAYRARHRAETFEQRR